MNGVLVTGIGVAAFGAIVRYAYVSRRYFKELTRAKVELQDTIEQQQGMTFKFKKIGNEFVHTLCGGDLACRLGFTPSKVVGRTLSEMFPAPEFSEMVKNKERHYDRAWNGESVTYQGEIHDVVYLASLRPIMSNGIVKEVIASCIDITDLRKTEEALRQSEARHRLIAENTSDLVRLADEKSLIHYASPSHLRVLGYEPNELENTNGVDLVHPDDRLALQATIQRMIDTKEPVVHEYRSIRKDGKIVSLETRGVPVLDEYGEIQSVVLTARDVTERKESEDALRKAEKLWLAGQLAAGIAHEIRNPLTTIKGFMQLQQLDASPLNPAHTELILLELTRVEDIINEFLMLAKPEAAKFHSQRPSELIYEVVSLCHPEASLRNVQIHLSDEGMENSVWCVRDQLKQVLLNIMKNAIESMPGGGNIYLGTFLREGKVHIRFIDEGLGIPEMKIAKLGEPFYTTKDRGTGLGLMISYRIIQEHGGHIEFLSNPGEGTQVDVILPIYDGTGTATNPGAETPSTDGTDTTDTTGTAQAFEMKHEMMNTPGDFAVRDFDYMYEASAKTERRTPAEV